MLSSLSYVRITFDFIQHHANADEILSYSWIGVFVRKTQDFYLSYP